MKLREKWNNGHRWRLLSMALAVALTWAVVVTVALIVRPTVEDPFGEYPVQSIDADRRVVVVHDREAGTDVDADLPVIEVSPGASVHVSGTKCITADDQVPVSGTVSWRMVSPRVRLIPVAEGQAVRNPGCETFEFDNPVPDEVLDAHAESGAAVTVWQITGTERTDAGAQQTWATENFALVDP